MNLATYASRNLFRRRGRTILTIIAVMLAVLIFCAIRTFIVAFNAQADDAAADRIATRHKVSITMQLPKHYIDELREVPGVKAATWANWFAAKDPKERLPFFAGIERVRYRRPVHAGDVVVIEAVVKRLRSRMGVLHGIARVDGKVAVEGTMTFALGPART